MFFSARLVMLSTPWWAECKLVRTFDLNDFGMTILVSSVTRFPSMPSRSLTPQKCFNADGISSFVLGKPSLTRLSNDWYSLSSFAASVSSATVVRIGFTFSPMDSMVSSCSSSSVT